MKKRVKSLLKQLPLRPGVVVLVLLAGSGMLTNAVQSTEPGAGGGSTAQVDDHVRALEKQIEELRKEVAAARAGGSVTPERMAELERRIDLLAQEIEKLRIGEAAEDRPLESEHGLGPAASKVYRKSRGVSIGGYGEALYQNFDSKADDGTASGARDSADLLRAVIYFGYKWTDQVLFNSEIEFEHATTGEGDEERGEASVEFANVEFLLHPELNVRAGLVLVPVGFINELHEPTVFYGARRPEVEQWILPTTWREVGAGVFGDAGPVSYRGYVIAGLNAEGFSSEGIREGRQQGSQSVAEDLAFTARADWTILPGLLAGASIFAGDSGQSLEDGSGGAIEAHVKVVEYHLEWKWRGLQTRVLAAQTSIGDVASLDEVLGLIGEESIGSHQAGWYAQAGFDVLSPFEGMRQSLIPFVRYEALDTQQRVPSGFARNPVNDRNVWTAGVSWFPIPQVVVKADYQNFQNRADSGVDQVNLGIGFIF